MSQFPGADAGPVPYPEAFNILNRMGGLVDWNALPIFAEIYGVTDIERLLACFDAIQYFQSLKANAD